jgi:hypothetical protein
MTISAEIQASALRDALMLDAYGVKPHMPHEARLAALAVAMNHQVLPNGTTTQAAMITAMIELDRAWSVCVLTRSDRAQDDLEDALNSIQDAFSAMIVAAETDLANADKPMIEVA